MAIAQCDPKRNILIDEQGNARLCGFGRSRILTEEKTSRMRYAGTARYLSYELLEVSRNPTTASDIYALACTGLEVSWGDF
jgi:serine/threonine protein kinase